MTGRTNLSGTWIVNYEDERIVRATYINVLMVGKELGSSARPPIPVRFQLGVGRAVPDGGHRPPYKNLAVGWKEK